MWTIDLSGYIWGPIWCKIGTFGAKTMKNNSFILPLQRMAIFGK